tara:strand:- start:99 stop:260 length:162 start_codon:yes stop_codon:yes gene_type:complete
VGVLELVSQSEQHQGNCEYLLEVRLPMDFSNQCHSHSQQLAMELELETVVENF